MRVRVLVCVSVVLASLFSFAPAHALSSSQLIGKVLREDLPYCDYGVPCTQWNLQEVDYVASGNNANVVNLSYLEDEGQDVCLTDGPTGCMYFGTGSAVRVTDANATITGLGLCTATAVTGSCAPKATEFGHARYFDPLPVIFALGSGNDIFTDVIDPSSYVDFALDVRGGPGSDKITLIDPTGGADVISCGDGADTVITTAATTVAPDCEKIERIA